VCLLWLTILRCASHRDPFVVYSVGMAHHRRPYVRKRELPWAANSPDLPTWPTLLAPLAANAFEELRISVSVALWTDQGPYPTWHPFHTVPNVAAFEYEHGVEARRWRYNHRTFAQARSERRAVRGTHAGFHDLFVPLVGQGEIDAVVVAGPFALARPTFGEVDERWHWLTDSHPRMADPSFSHYLTTTLGTLTLEGSLAATFERFMSCFARMVAGHDGGEALAQEARMLRGKLAQAVFVERAWDEARAMVDERTAGLWSTLSQLRRLEFLGLDKPPQHVVAGLLIGRPDELGAVEDVLRRDAFQRAAVALARKAGHVVCGRIGDHGVAFLVDAQGSAVRVRARLVDLAARATALAKRFGLRLHIGIGQEQGGSSLPARYRAALGAAEEALSRGVAVVQAEGRPEPSIKRLRELRRRLAESVGDRPSLLSPRFERYIEAVLVHAGYRMDPARAHLEAGLERLAEPLLATGALDQRSFDDLYASVERAAVDAPTVTELVGPYRRLVSDIEAALQSATAARQNRGARRAISFIREHLSEPLRLAQVARVAGFAPGYFSKLFKREEGVTFEEHVRQLRVARAKQMLTSTSLSVERVGKLSGFVGRSHFQRVFKEAVGATPLAYRHSRRR
jgi:AraC-like DNA-binding protein